MWHIDISEWDQEELKEKISPKIDDLIKELREVLRKKLKDTKGKKVDKNITEALITKILMGTIGCMPAYDSYFKKGRKGTQIARTIDNQKKNAFKTLVDFHFFYKKALDKIRGEIDKYERETYNKNDSIEYPIMKLIDMHFWKKGQAEIAKKRKLKEKKKRFYKMKNISN